MNSLSEFEFCALVEAHVLLHWQIKGPHRTGKHDSKTDYLVKRRRLVTFLENNETIHTIGLGLWMKQLRAKTHLNKPIIERLLKTLLDKNLIKRVPSAQVGINFFTLACNSPSSRSTRSARYISLKVQLHQSPWLVGPGTRTTNSIQHLSAISLKLAWK